MSSHGRHVASSLIVFALVSALGVASALGRGDTLHTQAHGAHKQASLRSHHRAPRHRRHRDTHRHHRRLHARRSSTACASVVTTAPSAMGANCAALIARHDQGQASPPPSNNSLPGISGSAIVGESLTASNGSWTGAHPIRYTYQWQRAGINIPSATTPSYMLVSADIGERIDVIVTASNPSGSQSATSPSTLAVIEETATGATQPSSGAESPPPPAESQLPPEDSQPQPLEGPTTSPTSPTEPELDTTNPALPNGPEVNAAPTGPPEPAGGWHVAFADGFGAKLGYAAREDNDWFLNKEEPANTYQPGLNSNELEVFNSSADRVGPDGLELLETYAPDVGGTGKNYVGGIVTTAAHATGQQPFSWKSGGPTTWAFECVAKWPHNTGEADPGWWSDATVNGVENEIDFFEGFGWGNTWHAVKEWSAAMPTVVGLNFQTVYGIEKNFGFDPTAGFHRYTTTLTPNGSKTVVAEYVDGVFRGSYEVSYPANRKTFTHLVLSYALREFPEGFHEGTRAFVIRSVAVYQDGAHAGQEIEGGGIAPGTVLR